MIFPDKCKMSDHASRRLCERTSLTDKDFLKIMNNEIYIPIGERNKRTHKLFYSEPDNECFVAIQAKDGYIITIMDLYKHQVWAWPVMPDIKKAAEDLWYEKKETKN